MSPSPDPATEPSSTAGHARHPAFVTTHWSVVLTAGLADTTRANDALARLCQTYWYPLYAYARRRGYHPHDAEDMTQAYFARLLDKKSLADIRRERGRFRSFLLASMNNFLAGEWHRARAKKRGGGAPLLSLNADSAETRYQLEPADPMTAERIFERRWALTLLDHVLQELQREYEGDGRRDLFEHLRFCLTGERSTLPYAELAVKVGMSEGAVKVAVHRLRQRYRVLLRSEIAHTVATSEEVEEEIRHLFSALAP